MKRISFRLFTAFFILSLVIFTGCLTSNTTPLPPPSGTPAATAGLKEGDVIVAVSDTPVNSAGDMVKAIQSTKIGQPVKVTYYRGDTKADTDLTPVQAPRG